MNDTQWDSGQPIYRQLRDRVVAMILEGELRDGDALPSVRQVAAEFRLNPITVLKGYQQLVDEQLIEKRRFLDTEWPKIRGTIQRLGLSAEQLLQSPAAAPAPTDARPDTKKP